MYDNLNDREHGGNSVLAFGLGMIAGAVTALLLAPASGTETRKALGHAASKVGDKAKDGFDATKQFVSDQKSRITGAVEEGKQTYRKETATSAM